jgi:hypothetical protein
VLVIEVDVAYPEPLQGLLARLLHVCGAPINAPNRRISRRADDAKLRGQYDPVPSSPDRPSDQLLVAKRPVHVRGVEEGDTEVQRTVNRRHGFRVLAPAIELGHPHTSQAERGHVELLGAELPLLHGFRPPVPVVADRAGRCPPHLC